MNKDEFEDIVKENQDIFNGVGKGKGAPRVEFAKFGNSVRFTLFKKHLQLACGNTYGVNRVIEEVFQIKGGLERLQDEINRGEVRDLCKVNSGDQPKSLVSVDKDADVQFMRKAIALYRKVN